MSDEPKSRKSPTRTSPLERRPSLTNFFLQDLAQQKAREFVFDGYFSYRQADYPRAEECFRNALTCDPSNTMAKKNVTLFDAVKQGKSEYDDALNEKAHEHYEKAQEHLESAKRCFQQALSIDPDYPTAKVYLLRVLSSEGFDKLARGDYETALFVFRQIFHFNPGYNSAYIPLVYLLTLKGKAALERKEWDVAEQLFTEAAHMDKFSNPTQSLTDSLTQELRQQQVELYIQNALRKEDAPRGALIELKKALEIDPLNSQALLYSGQCHEELGEITQAIRCYQKIREEMMDGYPVLSRIERAMALSMSHHHLFNQAKRCLKKHQFDKAIAAVNEILEDASEHGGARLRLEEIERAKEEHAQKEIRRATYARKLRSTSWQTDEGNPSQPDSSQAGFSKRPRNGL